MKTENGPKRIALTGFMGVGKSTVSRHLGRILKERWIDLDDAIEEMEKRKIAAIVDSDGLERFRAIESEALRSALEDLENKIISLGGGAFTSARNRGLIKDHGLTSIWLGAPFEHCWANITSSYRERPLARDRNKAKRLYLERERHYCLADWHFQIMPGCNSYAVAGQIAEQVFGLAPN